MGGRHGRTWAEPNRAGSFCAGVRSKRLTLHGPVNAFSRMPATPSPSASGYASFAVYRGRARDVPHELLPPEQAELVDGLTRLVERYGRKEILDRVGGPAQYGFDHPVYAIFLLQGHTKNVEHALSVFDDVVARRYSAAASLTRTLMEAAVYLTWAGIEPEFQERERRLTRLIGASARDIGQLALDDEATGLPSVLQRAAGEPRLPDVRAALRACDSVLLREGRPREYERGTGCTHNSRGLSTSGASGPSQRYAHATTS